MIMEITYNLRRIETQQFAIFPEKLMANNSVKVNVTFTFQVQPVQNLIRCDTNLTYEQEGQTVLILALSCIFELNRESFDTFKKKEEIVIPVGFLRHVGSIIVGTARGIIHAKTEGTSLNGIILPPINLMEMMKSDFVAPLKQKEEI